MKYLYVGATPETARDALPPLEASLAEFGLPLRRLEIPGLDFAFDRKRGQYASIPVLEMLTRLCPPDAAKLIALTERDLFIPVLTFVFGHAQLGGRVAVVSFARLRQQFYGLEPDAAVFLERACKEVLHETGHTFGLVHCADPRCAMSLSTRVQQIDAKRESFCAACALRLSKGVMR